MRTEQVLAVLHQVAVHIGRGRGRVSHRGTFAPRKESASRILTHRARVQNLLIETFELRSRVKLVTTLAGPRERT